MGPLAPKTGAGPAGFSDALRMRQDCRPRGSICHAGVARLRSPRFGSEPGHHRL